MCYISQGVLLTVDRQTPAPVVRWIRPDLTGTNLAPTGTSWPLDSRQTAYPTRSRGKGLWRCDGSPGSGFLGHLDGLLADSLRLRLPGLGISGLCRSGGYPHVLCEFAGRIKKNAAHGPSARLLNQPPWCFSCSGTLNPKPNLSPIAC